MEVAIINTAVLLIIILMQWASIREKNKVISDLEKDNDFWVGEYTRYATMCKRLTKSISER